MRNVTPKGRGGWVALLVTAFLAWFVVDYVTLPAYNPQSFGFWILAAIFAATLVLVVGGLAGARRSPAIAVGVGSLLVLVAILASATSWLVWPGNAGRYYRQMATADRGAAEFAADFPDMASAQGKAGAGIASGGAASAAPGTAAASTAQSFILPRTDKELSTAIAQGKLGTFGARFRMDSQVFTSMAVQRGGATRILRVSPLDYTGFMVALTGGSRGTAGYIEVDQETEEGRLVEVAGGMKYTPGAVFGHDLDRHLRFRFRSLLFGQKSFELDDSGKPFWVVPVVRNRVGLFGGPDADGVVTVDPSTGDCVRYARGEEPSWLDRAIPADIAIAQANNHLRLKDGWINAILGEKRDVFQLSDSYNYVVSMGADGAHTWLVSGVTSPSLSDQSLAGLMMINLRTKEARRYAMSGITEMRAMEIAQSDERVRAQNLEATWPIVVELGGERAYYLFLKNAVQRQRFVYLDVATGQKVAMGETIEAARSQFLRMLGQAASVSDAGAGAAALRKATGQVLRVRESAEDRSLLFLLAGEPEVVYQAPLDLSNGVLFLSPGDRVEVGYRELPASPGRRFVQTLDNKSLGGQR